MTEEIPFVLGNSDQVIRCTNRQQAEPVISALILQATRNIAVWAPSLDPGVYNSFAINDALAHFAAAHHRNRATILIDNIKTSIRQNPRLISVCRRFSTFIQVKRYPADYPPLEDYFVVVDQVGYYLQPQWAVPSGIACMHDRRKATQLQRRFQQHWQIGESPPRAVHCRLVTSLKPAPQGLTLALETFENNSRISTIYPIYELVS